MPTAPDSTIKDEQQKLQALLDRPENGEKIAQIRWDLGISMDKNVAVFRTAEGLDEQQEEIKKLKARYETVPIVDKGKVFNTDLLFGLELGYLLDCAEAIVLGAVTRTESRGAQFRLDHPERNDADWLKHILLTYSPEGIRLDYQPVTITQWEPKERTY